MMNDCQAEIDIAKDIILENYSDDHDFVLNKGSRIYKNCVQVKFKCNKCSYQILINIWDCFRADEIDYNFKSTKLLTITYFIKPNKFYNYTQILSCDEQIIKNILE